MRARVRLLMNRLDRHVAVLQCIEAIRLYAAANDGKLPNQLNNIIEAHIPEDPVLKKPFTYHCINVMAILEAPAPEGTTIKEAMRYELKMATK